MTEHTLLGTITIPTLYKRSLSFGKNELFALVTTNCGRQDSILYLKAPQTPHHSMTIAHDRLRDNLDQHHCWGSLTFIFSSGSCLSGFSWKSSTVLASPLAQSSGLCFGTHLPQRAPHSSVQTPTFSQMLSSESPSASTALEFLMQEWPHMSAETAAADDSLIPCPSFIQ